MWIVVSETPHVTPDLFRYRSLHVGAMSVLGNTSIGVAIRISSCMSPVNGAILAARVCRVSPRLACPIRVGVCVVGFIVGMIRLRVAIVFLWLLLLLALGKDWCCGHARPHATSLRVGGRWTPRVLLARILLAWILVTRILITRIIFELVAVI